MINIFDVTAAFWYAKFRVALSDKKFETAEEYHRRYQHFLRRAKLAEMLTEYSQPLNEKEKRYGRK